MPATNTAVINVVTDVAKEDEINQWMKLIFNEPKYNVSISHPPVSM